MTRYITRQGDMVDAIAWTQMQGRPGATEAILDANPGLAARGPLLPANLSIELPDPPPAAPRRIAVVDLWS